MITRDKVGAQSGGAVSSAHDAVTARQSSAAIAEFVGSEDEITVILRRADGATRTTTVPGLALQRLAGQLREVADGRALLAPEQVELTTHQAAALLNVSRPYLIKQMEAGLLPFRKVGTHRRIRYGDLCAYEARDREARHRGLDELAALSEEMNLYENEPAGSDAPPRSVP